jgi:HK97 family phage major capsid protein
MNEVKTLHHDQNSRVDVIEKEMKKLGEEQDKLVSQIGMNAIPAEYKSAHEALNAKMDELIAQVEKERIEAARPKMAEKRNERSKEHKSFMKAMRKLGKVDFLDQEDKSNILYHQMTTEQREQKALYAGDSVAGGFFAAQDYIQELLEYRLLISKVRKFARIQTTSGESVKMPALTDDASAFWATEQASYAESTDPHVQMLNIPVHEVRGRLRISEQNLEDSQFDLEGLIKERLMLKFAQTEGTAFIRGNGVGKARGILSYPIKASSGYTGGSAGKNNVTDAIPYVPSGVAANITADSILALIGDVKEDYEPNLTFAMTRGTLWSIRLFKDALNRPLWQPFGGDNLPGAIYGRPYITMPDIDEIAANLYPIILGDFKYYMIVDRVVMTMRKLDELYAEQGLVGFIARMRVGGDLILPEAFRVLKASVS